MRSALTDIEVFIHVRTERAVLVSVDGDRERAVWLPLSQIEVEDLGGGRAEATLPEWP
jgi:hypothetical protein